jgi:hypothetical protein
MPQKIPICVVTLGVMFLANATAVTQSPAPPDVPRAVVVDAVHDFGTIDQGTVVRHTFTIRNDSAAPLTVSKIDLSQPAMKSRFGRTIAPGTDGRITIEWDVARISGDATAEAVVHVDDPGQPRLTLTLTGRVIPPIEIKPGPALFFSVYRDEIAEQSVTIVNNEGRPLSIGAVRSDRNHFLTELKTIESGKVYEIRVRVPSGQAAGRYLEAFHVETDHPGRREMRIGVNVFIKNDLYATPESVAFDRVSLDQLRRPALAGLLGQRIFVRKRRGIFKITKMSTDVRGLRIERSPSPSESAAVFRIDVGLDPGVVQAGPLDGTISISTDDKDFPTLTIPVQGTVK